LILILKKVLVLVI